jgi:hypothetical protein
MRRRHHWLAGALTVVVLLLPSCRTVEEEDSAGEGPARIETVEGTDRAQVIMTAEATERLDIRTATVRDGKRADQSYTLIPHASVFYGPSGEVWTYTSPDPLTFERTLIEVDRIDGDVAFLTKGPPSGAQVVTRGAAQLFGIETGVDES